MLGYTMKEMEGGLKRWMELIHPEDRDDFRETIEYLIATKEPAHLEFRVRRKDGTYIFVEDSGHFTMDAKGNITRMIGFVKDITERRLTGHSALPTTDRESMRNISTRSSKCSSPFHPANEPRVTVSDWRS